MTKTNQYFDFDNPPIKSGCPSWQQAETHNQPRLLRNFIGSKMETMVS
jgi:hypothetical protein